MNHPSKICVRILTGLVVSSPLYATQYFIDILPPPLIHPVGINAKGEVAGDGGYMTIGFAPLHACNVPDPTVV